MKRRSSAETSQEKWPLPYAGFMTALFAVFVILYAMSKTDVEKLKKVNDSMREAFHDAPAVQGLPPGAATDTAAPPPTAPAADPGMNQARDGIRETLALETSVTGIADKVQVSEDDRGLVVSLAARDFFDDGVIEARADLRPLLDRIAKVIATIPNQVRIEGHTDIEEDKTDRRNGWQLSAERAGWVVQYWIKRWGLDPARLSAAGFSHFHPLTKRKDDYSRGKNRRVEIIIIRMPPKSSQSKKSAPKD